MDTQLKQEQDRITELLESTNPELVARRGIYTNVAQYRSPRIVKLLVESSSLEVTTDNPALATFAGVVPSDVISDQFETWVILREAVLEDPRYGYIIELHTLSGFEENPKVDESWTRVVGGMAFFGSDEVMNGMRQIVPDDDQRFGPVVLPANRQLQSLAEEQPDADVTIRVTRQLHGVLADEEEPFKLGPIALAFVET